MFAPLRHRWFRLVWLATLLSNLGSMVQLVAVSWEMTRLTKSVELIALVQGAQNLPIMLFSIGAGALADSLDRRRIMLVAQALTLGASVGLLVVAVLGALSPLTILAFTFLIGAGTALNNPSWQTSIGDLVPRDAIPAAVTLNGMSTNLVRSIGPAIGGMIIAAVGAAFAFAANALSSLPLLAALLGWKPPVSTASLPRERLTTAISDGLRYVTMSPNHFRTMSRSSLFGISATCVLALLPVIADRLLGGGPLAYGTLFAGFGVGGIGGAFITAPLRRRFSNETIASICCLVFGAAMAGLAASGSLFASLTLIVPAGASWVVALSMFNAVIQLATPRWVVGRVMSIYQTATFGGMAAGSWVWGLVAERAGTAAALFWAAGMVLLCGLVGRWLPVPGFDTGDIAPLDKFREPTLGLDLKPQSGPIMVTISYEIAEDDVPGFLAAMNDRRRIRIRDGARRWGLFRDLEDPRLWTEKYNVATWAEYLRHNQRRTRADAETTEALYALHQGAEPPRISRMIQRPAGQPAGDHLEILRSGHDH